MPSFPIHTIDFWLVTLAFAAALVYLLRGVLPIPFVSAAHRRKRGERPASLTIAGKPVGPLPASDEPPRPPASPATERTP